MTVAKQKMEWVVVEQISLHRLSLNEVKNLMVRLSKKYGKDALLEIDTIKEEHYSYREDSPYITAHSVCQVKVEKPVLSPKEKKKQEQQREKEAREHYKNSIDLALENVKKQFAKHNLEFPEEPSPLAKIAQANQKNVSKKTSSKNKKVQFIELK